MALTNKKWIYAFLYSGVTEPKEIAADCHIRALWQKEICVCTHPLLYFFSEKRLN